jgi:hypothetical protein
MNATAIYGEALASARDTLTDLWTSMVHEDRRILSDQLLTETQLIDHVPRMIDEVAELLRNGETPSIHEAREARVHVYLRHRQGYRGRDLVRELSILRLVVLDYFATVPDERPSLTIREHAEASRIVNLYLDEELRYAVSIFSETNSSAEEDPGGELSAITT